MQPGLRESFERLEASRTRVLAGLAGLETAALNRSPWPGRWLALQARPLSSGLRLRRGARRP
jgi:hypothetical protein